MSDTFTKPVDDGADPDHFELEAWISGARLPERTVHVYGRADLVGEIERLEAELYDAQKADDGADRRLSGTRVRQIAQAIEDAQKAAAKSRRSFRFRGHLHDEVEQVEKDAGKGAQPEEITYRLLSLQCVSEDVPWQSWPKIRKVIGEGQFGSILEAARSATADRRISVPSPLAASAVLAQRES